VACLASKMVVMRSVRTFVMCFTIMRVNGLQDLTFDKCLEISIHRGEVSFYFAVQLRRCPRAICFEEIQDLMTIACFSKSMRGELFINEAMMHMVHYANAFAFSQAQFNNLMYTHPV
jgi:hypothetical protein